MAKTFDQLEAVSKQVETEKRWGFNTAYRIGRLFYDIIIKLKEVAETSGNSPGDPSEVETFEPTQVLASEDEGFEPTTIN